MPLAWLKDQETLRAYGSTTDAYRVFGKMLAEGNPPTDRDVVLAAAAQAKAALAVFRR